jgi:hypothetical protein
MARLIATGNLGDGGGAVTEGIVDGVDGPFGDAVDQGWSTENGKGVSGTRSKARWPPRLLAGTSSGWTHA